MKRALPSEIQRAIGNQSLGVEVTTRCNSACTYCFVRASGRRSTDLTRRMTREILVEGHAAGYRRLHITGGEPLLWDGLFELLRSAEKAGYTDVLINTNGLLLDNAVCRRLTEFDSVRLTVSLQGGADLHDRTRGAGTYWKTRDRVAAALDAGLSVYLFTTVFNCAISHLTSFAREINAAYPALKGHCFVQLIRVHRDRVDLSKDLVGPLAFLDLVREVALLKIYGLNVDILNNPLAGVASVILGLPWASDSPPLSPPGRLMILANGEMALNHSGRQRIGTYSPGMIQKVLSSDAYTRAVAEDRKTCPKCAFHRHCRAFGMARPLEGLRDHCDGAHYCQRVLTAAAEQRAVA